MESAALFLLFSPIWFTLVAVASIGIIFALEKDKDYWAGGVIIATLFVLNFWGGTPILPWVLNFNINVVYWFAGYVALGAIWMLFKWWALNYKIFSNYETYKKEWLFEKGITTKEVPDALKEEWNKELKSNYNYSIQTGYAHVSRTQIRVVQIEPRIRDNINRILSWMIYWPWSLFWYCFNNLIINVFKNVQKLLNGTMESITRMVFGNIEDDFTVK